MHLLGPHEGGFRVKLDRCPADLAEVPEVEGAVEDLLAATMFPGVPLAGTSIGDLDNRRFEALTVARAEEPYIRDALIEAERARLKAKGAGRG